MKAQDKFQAYELSKTMTADEIRAEIAAHLAAARESYKKERELPIMAALSKCEQFALNTPERTAADAERDALFAQREALSTERDTHAEIIAQYEFALEEM